MARSPLFGVVADAAEDFASEGLVFGVKGEGVVHSEFPDGPRWPSTEVIAPDKVVPLFRIPQPHTTSDDEEAETNQVPTPHLRFA